MQRETANRRAMLGRLATGATALALPATALAAEPDPHPVWLVEWRAAVDFMNGPACREVEMISDLPIYHRALELEDLIGTTSARTIAGVRDQLRMLRHWCTPASMPNETLDAALENALATVEQLAGGQVHV